MMRFLVQYGPACVGLLLAFTFLLVKRSKRAELPRQVRLLTGVSLAIATGCYVIMYATRSWPGWQVPLPIPEGPDQPLYVLAFIFALPLALTIIVLVFLIFPMPRSKPSGTASLAPRGLRTFTSRGQRLTVAVLASCTLVIAVLAGLASSPDEQGRHTMYYVSPSAVISGGTGIYGWWFSVPCMILIAVLVAVTYWSISAITSPALSIETEIDSAVRTQRVKNILVVSSGGLLLHLANVLSSLTGTASLRTMFNGGDLGTLSFAPAFAALKPALFTASQACLVLGLACWWTVILSTLLAKSVPSNKVLAP